MLDREKIVAVLRRRFPGASTGEIAAAANALVGLDDEWEEVVVAEMAPCSESCWLASSTITGHFKVLRKRDE